MLRTCIAFIAVVALTGFVIAGGGRIPAAHASPTLLGDANCDSIVNSVDAALVLQDSAGLVSSLACMENADVNQDGSVNSIDAALVLQNVAGLIGPSPTPSPLTRQDLVDFAHFLYCHYHYGGYGPWTVPVCQPGAPTDGEAECIIGAMLHHYTLEQITSQGLDATAAYIAADVQSCITRFLPAPL